MHTTIACANFHPALHGLPLTKVVQRRIDKLSKSFKHAYVLIPHSLLTDTAVMVEVCRCAACLAIACQNERAQTSTHGLARLSTKDVSCVYMPAGADFTATAINLSKSVFRAAAHEKQWRIQVGPLQGAARTLSAWLGAAVDCLKIVYSLLHSLAPLTLQGHSALSHCLACSKSRQCSLWRPSM
jgi:hypothetical protein